MKKTLLFPALALALLGLASCSNELNEPNAVPDGTEVTVSFDINLPDDLGTRAVQTGNGTNCNQLYYAVFESNTGKLVKKDQIGAFNGALTDKVQFSLITGREYDFVFFAQNWNSPYSIVNDYVVSIDYSDFKANGENDAFYNQVKKLKITNGMNETVKLYRPFAQLNIGTTQEDLDNSAAAGFSLAETAVTVPVYDGFSLMDGTLVGDSQERTFTSHTINDIPGDFPVDGYKYIGLNYLLVNERELVTVKFNAATAGAADSQEFTYGNVPVQRNYRTNIYGNLLTTTFDYNIEIVPDFEQPDNNYQQEVKTADDFITALKSGNVTKLIVPSDLDLTNVDPEDLKFDDYKEIAVAAGATMTLPAKGTLIAENGLTLTGKGTITNNHAEDSADDITNGNTYRQLIRVMHGELLIDGTTLINDMDYHLHASGADYPYNSAAVSYYNETNVTIKNATIKSGEFTLCGMGRGVASGVVTLENSYFESTSSNKHNGKNWSYAIRMFGSTGTVTDCTVVGIQGGLSVENINCTIKGGLFTTHESEKGFDAFYPLYITNGAVVTVEGGEFAGAREWDKLAQGKSAIVCGDNDTNLPNGGAIIKGGKFSGLPYNHVTKQLIDAPEGYEYVENTGADKDIYPYIAREKE